MDDGTKMSPAVPTSGTADTAVGFEKAYFQMAYGSDYERRNPPYKWRAFLRELLRFRRGGELLEVGCGFGLFLKEAEPYFDCTGSDISEYAVTEARRRLPPSVPLFCGALEQLPATRRFDVIAAFDVLEHVKALPLAIGSLDRLLRPGGILVYTVPVYDGPLGWLVARWDHDATHIHRVRRDFWLKEALMGSHLLMEHYAGVWRLFVWNRFYINHVSRLSRRWATAVLVIAEKKTHQVE